MPISRQAMEVVSDITEQAIIANTKKRAVMRLKPASTPLATYVRDTCIVCEDEVFGIWNHRCRRRQKGELPGAAILDRRMRNKSTLAWRC